MGHDEESGNGVRKDSYRVVKCSCLDSDVADERKTPCHIVCLAADESGRRALYT